MPIEHDAANHRFIARYPEGSSELRYRIEANGVMNLFHSETDATLRGRGIASDVAQAAFDYARANGLKVRATCPYVIGWLTRHPEVRDLLWSADDPEGPEPTLSA